MSWSKLIRQTHRWLSIVFTVLVIVNIVLNFVAPGPEQLTLWVGLLTLVPLALLMFTGLYLFVLPYAARWRDGMRPDFDSALQRHFEAISNRDIEAFKAHLTRREVLYTIVQNGHAFTTPEETVAIHEEWFRDPSWTWEGRVVHEVVGEDVAMALVKYDYRARPGDEPFSTWLVYVFQVEDGEWRIVHDQNTALDFPAFARASGIDLPS